MDGKLRDGRPTWHAAAGNRQALRGLLQCGQARGTGRIRDSTYAAPDSARAIAGQGRCRSVATGCTTVMVCASRPYLALQVAEPPLSTWLGELKDLVQDSGRRLGGSCDRESY